MKYETTHLFHRCKCYQFHLSFLYVHKNSINVNLFADSIGSGSFNILTWTNFWFRKYDSKIRNSSCCLHISKKYSSLYCWVHQYIELSTWTDLWILKSEDWTQEQIRQIFLHTWQTPQVGRIIWHLRGGAFPGSFWLLRVESLGPCNLLPCNLHESSLLLFNSIPLLPQSQRVVMIRV